VPGSAVGLALRLVALPTDTQSPLSPSTANTARRIAVLGGGISGLAAALRCQEIDPSIRLTLFEASARLGGVLWTVEEDGYQVEQSADNFITTVPWGLALCRKLGLEGDLVQTNPAFRHTFVVHRGKLCRLPDGFLMMAPTRMWPMAVTPLLSPLGKLRAGLEYFIPPRKDPGDESMAAFVRRRLGREVFDNLVEPLVSAVYAADMERLSVDATLSQFREMELNHGSLIRAMRRRMKATPTKSTDTGARYSMFVTPRRGLTSMVDAIAAKLPAGVVRLSSPVEKLERFGPRWIVTAGGIDQEFDAVIVATPSTMASKLLATVEPALSGLLGQIEHSGTAILSVAYKREQVRHPLDGMGVVVPAVENSPLLACSLSNQKYPHRAPPGTILLRLFAGGARRPELATMDDRPLCELLLAECDRLLGITGKPLYTRIAHWPGTMPQYHVGHRDLVAQIENRAAALHSLRLAGNAFHGVGIPHCIHSGEKAAEAILGVSRH